MSCGAGTPVAEVDAALAEHGQRVAIPPTGTVGGALAVGRSGIRRLGDGPIRDAVLQVRYVSAAGEIVKAGGPTVKNVSGFDLCRLLVGSRGTLGFLGDVILRTRPLARCVAVVPRPPRPGDGARPAVPAGVGAVGRRHDVGAARGRRARRRRPRRRRSACRRPTAHRSCRRAGAGRSRRSRSRVDGHVRRRGRRRRGPSRRAGAGADASTRRSSSCTGGSRSASTRPGASTPASTRSMR